MPEFSIITVNYNNNEGLQKTMQSVFAQGFKEYEYIIIDGGSADGSKEYIEQFADKLSYRVSESDGGIYDAMNKGIARATGKYLLFLNSGDYLLHENVLYDVKKIMDSKHADIYYGNIELSDEKKHASSLTYPTELTLNFWENSTINHQAAFIKSTLFKELGMYDGNYSIAADYAFFLKCFSSGKCFRHLNEEIVHYSLDGASSLDMDEYKMQMKKAWRNIVPVYVDQLYREQKEHTLLMKHRLMRWANFLNSAYKKFIGGLKN